MLISGRTRLAGILGGPEQVKLSLSPAIHNAAFQDLDMDWAYLPFGSSPADLPRAIRGLADAGVRGMNVTMPHKLAALDAMDEVAPSAMRVGAVNTIEVRGERLIGHNTDGDGLVRFLRWDLGVELCGANVVLVGAGGSARAAAAALAAAGVGHLCVLARDPSRAIALQHLCGSTPFVAEDLAGPVSARVENAAVVINATPAGQKGEPPVIPVQALRPGALLVDLVYRPPVTPLIKAARAAGAAAHSGLGMLLHQAALSFEIWTGVQPSLEVMSAAAAWELAREEGRP